MFNNKLYTPLRYPGGKARFAPFIAEVMRSNQLEGGHYLEPYAGGAGVALELLFHDHASHIHINDLDPAVNAFWVAVTDHTSEVLRLLNDTPITIEEWYRWRAVMTEDIQATPAEKGFATLFINRTNRSGILKAGVIGGKNQTGNYKLDARFKKDVLSARIERIAERSNNITVYCEDALNLLSRCDDFLPADSLIYLDPPYYVKGRGLYRNFYTHNDHQEIANALNSHDFNRPWVVSYDNAPQICEMYSNCSGLSYGLNYTAQNHYVGDEVVFLQSGMHVPAIPQPDTRVGRKRTACIL